MNQAGQFFTIDLKEWFNSSKLLNYADETSTSHSNQELNILVENLNRRRHNEHPALKASNGLVAKLRKIKFMLLNNKKYNPRPNKN